MNVSRPMFWIKEFQFPQLSISGGSICGRCPLQGQYVQEIHSTLYTFHTGNTSNTLLQESVLRDCISMCFDICTINIRVSIRVRGLHLVHPFFQVIKSPQVTSDSPGWSAWASGDPRGRDPRWRRRSSSTMQKTTPGDLSNPKVARNQWQNHL